MDEKWSPHLRVQKSPRPPSAACSSSATYRLRDPRRLCLLLLSGFPPPRSGPAGRPCCGNSGPHGAGCSRVLSDVCRTAAQKLLSLGTRVWLPLAFSNRAFEMELFILR